MAKLYTYEFGGRTYRTPNRLNPEQQASLVADYHEAGLLNDEAIKQEETSYKDNLENPELLNAYRTFANNKAGKVREDLIGDDKKTLDEYYDHMRFLTVNTGSVFKLGRQLAGDQFNEEERQAVGMMYNVWDNTVPFYKDSVSKWDAVFDYGEAIVRDPATWMGLLTGGYGTLQGQAAKQVAQLGIRKAVAAYAGKGAKWGAIEGAAQGAAYGHFDADTRGQIGIGDGSSVEHVLKSAGIGSVAGTLFGGAAGGAAGAVKGAAAKKAGSKVEPVMGENTVIVDKPPADKARTEAGVTTPEQAAQNVEALGERIAARVASDGTDRRANEASRQAGLDAFKQQVTGNLAVQLNKTPKSSQTLMEKDFKKMTSTWDLGDVKTDGTVQPLTVERFVNKMADSTTIPADVRPDNYVQFLKTAETVAWQNFKKAEADPENFMARYSDLEKLTTKIEFLGSDAAKVLKATQGRLDPELASQKLGVFERANLIQKIANTSDVDAAKAVIKNMQDVKVGRASKAVAVANDVFVHNILGAWSTIAVNTASSLAHHQYRIMQRGVGGVLTGDAKAVRSAMVEQALQIKHIHESAGYFLHALNTSRGSISPYRTAFDAFDGKAGNGVIVGDRDMSIGTLGKQKGESLGMYGANVFGNLNRLLGRRLMISTDEFMKQQAFRTTVSKKLIERYLDEGSSFTEALQKANVQSKNIIDKHIDDMANNIQPVQGSIAAEALEEANVVTFQNAMAKDVFGELGRAGTTLRNKAPIFTQLLPFIRTPSNLLTFIGDRTPALQMTSKSLRERLNSPNPQVAAEAEAAMALGTMMWAGVFMMAGSGMITGQGTTDRNRANVENMSDQFLPYSINGVGIRRLDPAARFAMVAGNISDQIMYGTEQNVLESFASYVFAGAKTMLEIPTLQSLKGIIEFATGTGGKNEGESKTKQAAKGIARHVQGFMPYYRFVEEVHFAEGNELFQNELRDIEGILKGKPHLLNWDNTKYLANTDQRRSPLDGRPIAKNPYLVNYSGLTKKEVKREEANELLYQTNVDEMRRLGMSLTPPVSKHSAWGSVDIKRLEYNDGIEIFGMPFRKGRSWYDVYQERVGTIEIPIGNTKMTLNERIDDFINSPMYAELRDPVFAKQWNDKKTRASEIKRIINEYRAAAATEVSFALVDNPKFRAILQHHANRTDKQKLFN